MSRFFHALEQAERDQALTAHERAASEEPIGAAAHVAVPAAGPDNDLPSAPRVAAGSDGVDPHLVSLIAPASFEAEQYRALRHLVEQLHKSDVLTVVAISSPGRGEGKTTTAINLAGALAQANESRVLLIDADLRRPSVAPYLGRDYRDTVGLVGALVNRRLTLKDAVVEAAAFNLGVLPAGGTPTVPYELFKSPRFGELLEQARRAYDYIVLDTPPLVDLPDCRVIAKWVDGFVIIVDAHRTTRHMVTEAMMVVDPAKVIGLVFNGDDRGPQWSYSEDRSVNGGDDSRSDRIGGFASKVKRAGDSMVGRLRARRDIPTYR